MIAGFERLTGLALTSRKSRDMLTLRRPLDSTSRWLRISLRVSNDLEAQCRAPCDFSRAFVKRVGESLKLFVRQETLRRSAHESI